MKDIAATLSVGVSIRHGTVKWFARLKGFGFVVVPDIEEDFLLHANILRQFGRSTVAEGSNVSFTYDATGGGYRVTEILTIEPPNIDDAEKNTPQPDVISDQHTPARVKWYDPVKGFGFVHAFGDNEDIFIGAAVLQKSTFGSLQSGEAICIQIAETEGRKSVFAVHDWA